MTPSMGFFHLSSVVLLVAFLGGTMAGDIKMKGMTFTADRYCKEVHFDDALSMSSLEHLARLFCS